MQITPNLSSCCDHTTRRSFLKAAGIATAAGLLSAGPLAQLAYAAALTKAQRDKLTPDEIIALMKQGMNASAAASRRSRTFSLSSGRAPRDSIPRR